MVAVVYVSMIKGRFFIYTCMMHHLSCGSGYGIVLCNLILLTFLLLFQPIKSSEQHLLKPGKNIITLDLPPQKPGSYVLGALTGQIGHLQFRSHGFSKAGPADSDDFMSYEKPTRPVLKVIFCGSYSD